jgi:hypothetical protein
LLISVHEIGERILSQLKHSTGPDGAPSRGVGCGGTRLRVEWFG